MKERSELRVANAEDNLVADHVVWAAARVSYVCQYSFGIWLKAAV